MTNIEAWFVPSWKAGRQLKITMQTIVNCWHTWGSMWNFRKVWRFQFVLENEDLFLRVLKNEEVKKSIFLHNEDEDKTIATFVEEEDFHLEKCSRLKIWRALLMMWTKWILRCVQGAPTLHIIWLGACYHSCHSQSQPSLHSYCVLACQLKLPHLMLHKNHNKLVFA